MDNKLLRRLESLADRSHRRSKVARLRDIFDHVERLLDDGFSRDDVLAELNAGGLDMSKASFKSALQRIRAERASKPGATPRDHLDGRATCPHCGAALDDQKTPEMRAGGPSATAQPAAPTVGTFEPDVRDNAAPDKPLSLSDAFLRGMRRASEEGSL
ncbi:hypothetical protein [Burkholderia pseudomallei]|uniref:hypothetical protein n=1 Tax=Burkholderia pseudomallei TaxID=28450 RepID=UPI000F071FD9|nr:hypothetical protein [Burkholderia pseudomallei]